MNQEFRRRLVKQISVFLQTWNIFVLCGEQQIHSLTLPRVERMLSLFPMPTFTFPPFLAGMNSSVITLRLHGEKHYLVLHNIELSAGQGYKMTGKHEPSQTNSQT